MPKVNTSAARIGYAWVSTSDQNLDAQIAAEAAGCTIIRTETGSGTTLENRSELGIILDFIHPGETLVVTRIDRLARSMKDLQVIVAKLRERGANIAATEQPVDTSTAADKAFFDMLGVFAEFETNLRREWQAEGIAAAMRLSASSPRSSLISWPRLNAASMLTWRKVRKIKGVMSSVLGHHQEPGGQCAVEKKVSRSTV